MKLQQPFAPAEFWLVRHGQTDWNIQRRFQGQTDIPLNTAGFAQARNLADSLNGSPIAGIYSSDLSRAVQTAAILAEGKNIPIVQDKRLREIDMGSWEGRKWQEVNEQLSAEMMNLLDNPVDGRAPGGESLGEVAERARSFADETSRRHSGEIVMVVSHGLTLGALRSLAEGLPLSQARQIIPENCSVIRVQWRVQG